MPTIQLIAETTCAYTVLPGPCAGGLYSSQFRLHGEVYDVRTPAYIDLNSYYYYYYYYYLNATRGSISQRMVGCAMRCQKGAQPAKLTACSRI